MSWGQDLAGSQLPLSSRKGTGRSERVKKKTPMGRQKRKGKRAPHPESGSRAAPLTPLLAWAREEEPLGPGCDPAQTKTLLPQTASSQELNAHVALR